MRNRRKAADRRKRAMLQRMEPLDRGLVAMRTDGGIFLSWRMFCTEDPVFGTAEAPCSYTLLRDGEVIAVLSGKTSYLDPDGTPESVYEVIAELPDGTERWDSNVFRSFSGSKNDQRDSAEDIGSGGLRTGQVRPLSSGFNYFDIPLERPGDSPFGPYTINDVSCGDLDGDGAYELVVKWDSGGLDNSIDGMTGNVLLDAYKLDGTRLWKQPIDLGVNIRAGAHYTQFLVYDLDRDGKSELILKTAPGSKDGSGRYVSQASGIDAIRACDNRRDFRNPQGHVLDGDEFLTVFDGETGAALDTIFYPNQRIDSQLWGDEKGNRSERYTAAVAWLDGQRPYAVFMRGYYLGRKVPAQARQCACAVSFDGKKLSCRYCFDTMDVRAYEDWRDSASFFPDGTYKGVDGYAPGNGIYVGEGNHNCTVADVDRDGCDEILTGALCYELDQQKKKSLQAGTGNQNSRGELDVQDGPGRLRVRWCSFRGHGDALHIGAYDPRRSGYLLFTTHEENNDRRLNQKPVLDYGMSVHDASTGEVLFHCGAEDDTGRGMMANVGAGGWYQVWGISEIGEEKKKVFLRPRKCTEKGFEEFDLPGAGANFRIFWDGDLYDELLDGEKDGPLCVTSWNGERMEEIFRTEGCVSINGTKANPCLQVDLLGDWREELVMARADNRALRVFVSDIPTDYSMMTLMHDPVYRAGVAAEQTAYNQPPHIGFYLGRECFEKRQRDSFRRRILAAVFSALRRCAGGVRGAFR